MLATMATARLPLRIRFGMAVLALIAVLLVGGATAVLQVGAGALQVTAGGEWSSTATSRTWFGLELTNDSSIPVVLRSVRPVVASNARIVETRVLDHLAADGGIGIVSPPVRGRLGTAVDNAPQVDGFVVPAHSENRYQLIVLVERIRPGPAAVVRLTDVGFTALGLDHGFRSHAVVCIRAPGARDCPPA